MRPRPYPLPAWRLPFAAAILLVTRPGLAEQQGNNDYPGQFAAPALPNQLPADIHDIYGPLPLADPVAWLPFIITAVVLLILVAVGLFFWLKGKKTSRIPAVPPHTAALAELDLAREYLLSNRSLLYGERVSAILRRYIEQRFNIGSTRQTTAEFLRGIHEKTAGDGSQLLAHKEALAKCMQHCDMAKFAQRTTDKAGMEEMEKGVRLFIEATMEVKEVG